MPHRVMRLGFLLLLCAAAQAAEPAVDSSQLPRVPPTPAEQALGTFKVKAGFRLELVAAEPLVVSPVAMSFDEDGRLYVIEMRDYSERRPERLGRVRLLEDTDGDGRYEKSTVFADGLPWPTAVTCWAGGVFVGATPDILWLKDTTGDGVADEHEIIFTGFASDYAPFATNKLNVQALMNSFQWTLDNRIHGATSFSGGKVKLVDSPFVHEWRRRGANVGQASRLPIERASVSGQPASALPAGAGETPALLDLRGRDFSFDPRTLEIRAESGGGQHGMTFDNQGRKFVCSNSDHLQQIVYEDRYAARNPHYTMPSPRVSIAADGPAAEVFRISPDEPWRVIRTKWRVAGQVSGPVEGGGRASGYFTGATGATIYRGDAYGEDFVGDAFIGDAGGNLVHRKKLRPDGIVMRAERPADERNVEFLASIDNWFRPVQFANAPDGCLYLADMYREVIEHPWSLPPNLKKHLDLNSGSDRGRIYRIVPEGFRPPTRRPLRRLSTKALVPLLAHPNGWMRDAAARLLYERQDLGAIPAILALVNGRTEPALQPEEQAHAAMHGLGVLAGMRVLPEQELVQWLGPNTRELSARLRSADTRDGLSIQFLKLAEPFLQTPSDALLTALRTRIEQTKNKRKPTAAELQLVLTLGQVRGPGKVELTRHFIESQFSTSKFPERLSEPDSTRQDLQWISPALVSGLGDDAMQLVEQLDPAAARRAMALPDAKDGIIAQIARVAGARNKSNDVNRIVHYARRTSFRGCASVLEGLQAGLRQSGISLDRHPAMAALDETFRKAATNATAGGLGLAIQADERVAAIRVLGFASDSGARSNLLWLAANSRALREYRDVALATLNRSGYEQFAGDVISVWPQLTPSLRSEALGRILQKPAWIGALLQSIEAGTLRAAELSIAQQAQLRSHRDLAIRERAAKVFGRTAATTRQSVVEALQPALSLKGQATKGRNTFQTRCATCHKLGSEGHALGPDLATMKSGGKEKLLIAILDPNREVAPNFASYSVETKDGESLTGILASESAASVTLRMAGGAESVVARANIASQSLGRSLMPEGLEEGLSVQEMADLLEFILSPP